MRERLISGTLIGLLLSGLASLGLAQEQLRDPTRPYSLAERKAAASPRYVVNAIIVSPERRVAIVNGQRVGVGESVDNATVISIEKQQLILEKDGRRITASLNDGAPRQ